MEIIIKNAFCVIGKAGSTNDGEGFVQKLWADVNAHFDEVSDMATKNDDGSYKSFWGAMTNFGFEYIKVSVNNENTFAETLQYLKDNNMILAGAVQDYTDPATGRNYMMFPISVNDSKRKLIKKIKTETDQFAVCGCHRFFIVYSI